jgi:hypothetical protein
MKCLLQCSEQLATAQHNFSVQNSSPLQHIIVVFRRASYHNISLQCSEELASAPHTVCSEHLATEPHHRTLHNSSSLHHIILFRRAHHYAISL